MRLTLPNWVYDLYFIQSNACNSTNWHLHIFSRETFKVQILISHYYHWIIKTQLYCNSNSKRKTKWNINKKSRDTLVHNSQQLLYMSNEDLINFHKYQLWSKCKWVNNTWLLIFWNLEWPHTQWHRVHCTEHGKWVPSLPIYTCFKSVKSPTLNIITSWSNRIYNSMLSTKKKIYIYIYIYNIPGQS